MSKDRTGTRQALPLATSALVVGSDLSKTRVTNFGLKSAEYIKLHFNTTSVKKIAHVLQYLSMQTETSESNLGLFMDL